MRWAGGRLEENDVSHLGTVARAPGGTGVPCGGRAGRLDGGRRRGTVRHDVSVGRTGGCQHFIGGRVERNVSLLVVSQDGGVGHN